MTLRIRCIIVALSALLALNSCNRAEEQIGPIENLTIERHGSVGATLSFDITNNLSRDIRLLRGEIGFCYRGVEIGVATLKGEIIIPKSGRHHSKSLWRIATEDPASMQMLESRIESEQWEDISLNIDMVVKSGIGKRHIVEESLPIESLQNILRRQ